MLLESGEPRLEVDHQSTREALGLGEGDLAELGARAGDGAAPEGRGVDAKPERLDLPPKLLGEVPRHVEDEEVLHAGGPQVARAVALGEMGHRAELARGEPTPEDRDADIGEAVLPLRVNTHVIAVDVVGRALGHRRLELLAEAPLELRLEPVHRPAMVQEEELETGLLAILPKDIAVTEDLRDALDHRGGLSPRHERVEPLGEMRIGGQPAAHPHRKAGQAGVRDGAPPSDRHR